MGPVRCLCKNKAKIIKFIKKKKNSPRETNLLFQINYVLFTVLFNGPYMSFILGMSLIFDVSSDVSLLIQNTP